MKRVILASGSPRRRELFSQTGLEFEVISADIDEDAIVRDLTYTEEESGLQIPYPARVVETLSAGKAEAVAEQITEGIVIGADTIVWNNGILGKPADREDAFRMLRQLQGGTHSVFTGVTVLVKECAEGCRGEFPDGFSREFSKETEKIRKHTFFCETEVDVYPMTEQETEAYLDTGESMDKAGAYGIQGKFSLWVKAIRGDYNSVVGLPLSALWQVLRQYV